MSTVLVLLRFSKQSKSSSGNFETDAPIYFELLPT